MPPGSGMLKDPWRHNQPIQGRPWKTSYTSGMTWGPYKCQVKFHRKLAIYLFSAIYKGPIYVTPFITIVFGGPLCSCNRVAEHITPFKGSSRRSILGPYHSLMVQSHDGSMGLVSNWPSRSTIHVGKIYHTYMDPMGMVPFKSSLYVNVSLCIPSWNMELNQKNKNNMIYKSIHLWLFPLPSGKPT